MCQLYIWVLTVKMEDSAGEAREEFEYCSRGKWMKGNEGIGGVELEGVYCCSQWALVLLSLCVVIDSANPRSLASSSLNAERMAIIQGSRK